MRLEETIPHPSGDFLTVAAVDMVCYMRSQLFGVADWAGVGNAWKIGVLRVDIMVRRQAAPLLATKHWPTKLDLAGTLGTPVPAAVRQPPLSGFLVVPRWPAAFSGQGGGRGDYDWRIWAQAVRQPHKGKR
jgi:hypothetical protein